MASPPDFRSTDSKNFIVVRFCTTCLPEGELTQNLHGKPLCDEWLLVRTDDYFEFYGICQSPDWSAIFNLQRSKLCNCANSAVNRFFLLRDDAVINLFRTSNEFGYEIIHVASKRTLNPTSWLSMLLQFVALESENVLTSTNNYDVALAQFEKFADHVERTKAATILALVEKHWTDIGVQQVERSKYGGDKSRFEDLTDFSRSLVQRLVLEFSGELQNNFDPSLGVIVETLFFPPKGSNNKSIQRS